MGLGGWLSKPFKWADRQLFGGGPPDSYGDEFDTAGQEARGYGSDATREYYSRAKNYNPQASLEQAAGGLYDQFERGVGRRIETLRGQEVGAGRLGGGYGAEDETAAIYDARADLNSKIASMALDTESMKLSNMRDIGAFGESQSNRYLDVLAGNRDAEMGRYNARTQQRAGFWSALAELGGKAFGAMRPGSGGAGGGAGGGAPVERGP